MRLVIVASPVGGRNGIGRDRSACCLASQVARRDRLRAMTERVTAELDRYLMFDVDRRTQAHGEAS